MTNVRLKYFSSAASFTAANVAAGDLCFINAGVSVNVGGTSYTGPVIVRVSGVSGSTINGLVFKGTDTNTWPEVVNSSATLAWNSAVTLGTIGGTAITAKLPAAPTSVDYAAFADEANHVTGVLTVNGVTYDGVASVSAAVSASNGLTAEIKNGLATIKHITAAAASGTFSASTGKYISGIKYDVYGHVTGITDATIPSAPVSSVNGKTGAVSLTYSDVSAASADHVHSASAITTDNIEFSENPGSTTANIITINGSDVQTMLEDLYEKQYADAKDIATLKGLDTVVYKGLIGSSLYLSNYNMERTGSAWFVSQGFTIPATYAGSGVNTTVEKGDLLILNSNRKYDVLNGENQVTASVTAGVTGAYTIGTVDGITLYGKDTNTTYSAEKGITLASGKFGHVNSITAQTTNPLHDRNTVTESYELNKFSVITDFTYDAYGHITSFDFDTVNIGDAAYKGYTTSVTSASYADEYLVTNKAVYDAIANKNVGVTSVSAGEGLTLASGTSITSSGTIQHVTAYTQGATHDAGTGKYISKITYDKFGHVTKIEDGTLPSGIKSVTGATNSSVTASNSSNNVTLDLVWIEY